MTNVMCIFNYVFFYNFYNGGFFFLSLYLRYVFYKFVIFAIVISPLRILYFDYVFLFIW